MRTCSELSEDLRIPDSISFETAASVVTPGIIAYYSLVDVARLTRGESVLIHLAAGATGQMAVWVAKMVGAEVFATVGLESKKEFLVDTFDIPADHIFYSRNTSFARGIMRMTHGRGVDVVLNSLSGDGLRASWECRAPYGRFVEIGKSDIVANSGLPMALFARNVSFRAVDLHYTAQSRTEFANGLLKKTMDLLAAVSIQHPSPLNVYPATDIEGAFRYLQSGRNTGRIVVSISSANMVPKRVIDRSSWKFDSDASYVVAGASGGLGRAISIWLAEKGARNLILLPRSGDKTPTASKVTATLRQIGVNVAAYKCDVSSESSLSAV